MKDNGQGDDFEEMDMLSDDVLYTILNDDRRAELNELFGLQVARVELWETSLGDDEDGPPVKPEARVYFDCYLLLDENQALELYVTSAYPDPDGDPVAGMDAIYDAVRILADESLELVDYDQADEEGGLALAFGRDNDVNLVLVASAWAISEWEAEPEEGTGEEE